MNDVNVKKLITQLYCYNLCIVFLQTLLHPYFFTEPLPAHHLELPIPQRTSKKMHRAHQTHEYNVDAPIEKVLVDPELIAPHVTKKP